MSPGRIPLPPTGSSAPQFWLCGRPGSRPLYLHALGITDLYASPFFRARQGSLHGYDVTDHSALNPEFGTEADLERLAHALTQYGMGLLMDVVPNHMGISEVSNRWWQDVLENGPSSCYAHFFDIDWAPPKAVLANKVLLPVLFIVAVLLWDYPVGLGKTQRATRRDFVLRFQQLTGPVMAKGLEDTAFYRIAPLASLNEVSGDPERFSTSANTFHQRNAERLACWPHRLLVGHMRCGPSYSRSPAQAIAFWWTSGASRPGPHWPAASTPWRRLSSRAPHLASLIFTRGPNCRMIAWLTLTTSALSTFPHAKLSSPDFNSAPQRAWCLWPKSCSPSGEMAGSSST